MNKCRASLVVISHLSDAQHLLGSKTPERQTRANNHLNFAKFIIQRVDNDLNTNIDPDKFWEAFTETSFYLSNNFIFTCIEYVKAGRHLQAVKTYRDATGKNLKECKDEMDSLREILRLDGFECKYRD